MKLTQTANKQWENEGPLNTKLTRGTEQFFELQPADANSLATAFRNTATASRAPAYSGNCLVTCATSKKWLPTKICRSEVPTRFLPPAKHWILVRAETSFQSKSGLSSTSIRPSIKMGHRLLKQSMAQEYSGMVPANPNTHGAVQHNDPQNKNRLWKCIMKCRFTVVQHLATLCFVSKYSADKPQELLFDACTKQQLTGRPKLDIDEKTEWYLRHARPGHSPPVGGGGVPTPPPRSPRCRAAAPTATHRFRRPSPGGGAAPHPRIGMSTRTKATPDALAAARLSELEAA